MAHIQNTFVYTQQQDTDDDPDPPFTATVRIRPSRSTWVWRWDSDSDSESESEDIDTPIDWSISVRTIVATLRCIDFEDMGMRPNEMLLALERDRHQHCVLNHSALGGHSNPVVRDAFREDRASRELELRKIKSELVLVVLQSLKEHYVSILTHAMAQAQHEGNIAEIALLKLALETSRQLFPEVDGVQAVSEEQGTSTPQDEQPEANQGDQLKYRPTPENLRILALGQPRADQVDELRSREVFRNVLIMTGCLAMLFITPVIYTFDLTLPWWQVTICIILSLLSAFFLLVAVLMFVDGVRIPREGLQTLGEAHRSEKSRQEEASVLSDSSEQNGQGDTPATG